ncbi:MAG: AAA family ATPase [Candidatus Margulisiibacteriota bacterium]
MKENPFVYGESVTGENFCNRKEEAGKLEKDLLASQKVFLISARKLGKTSLIKMVLEKLKKKGFLTIFIDLEGFSSYKQFLDAYLLALTQQATVLDKLLTFIRQIIPGLRVDFTIDEVGRPSLSLGYQYPTPDFDKIARKIFALPEVISKRRRKKMVVVFDEFQEILNLNGENIEGTLRAAIQHQRRVAYIFAGSKKHLLSDMVTSPERPFYKIGPIMRLKKIPEKDFFEYIKAKFQSTKIKISDEIINNIIMRAENIPYYVQMFAHELWDYAITKGEVKAKDLEIVINQLVGQFSPTFHQEWSRLILSKRQLLQAIALSGGKNILSKDYLERNKLGLPSAARRTLTSLVDEGYLDKEENEYFFNDLLFREWIKSLR